MNTILDLQGIETDQPANELEMPYSIVSLFLC